MKIFWPHRLKAKGFLIQNLPFKQREKIASASPDETSNKSLVERNVKSLIKNREYIGISHLSINRGH